jgi:hypothetical protein
MYKKYGKPKRKVGKPGKPKHRAVTTVTADRMPESETGLYKQTEGGVMPLTHNDLIQASVNRIFDLMPGTIMLRLRSVRESTLGCVVAKFRDMAHHVDVMTHANDVELAWREYDGECNTPGEICIAFEYGDRAGTWKYNCKYAPDEPLP